MKYQQIWHVHEHIMLTDLNAVVPAVRKRVGAYHRICVCLRIGRTWESVRLGPT